MRKVSDHMRLVKGKRVQILRELVTVIRKRRLITTGRPGRESKRQSVQSGDLPFAVQE